MDDKISLFEEALLSLDRIKIREMLTDEDHIGDILKRLEDVLVPAMENIGKKWEKGELALSQIYMSGKICEEIVDELIPKSSSKRVDDPNIALAVFQDHHILGKMMVYTFLRASGYELFDYGHQSDPRAIVEKLKKDDIKILLISVLMLNSALHIKELMEIVREELPELKVVVGGAPFRFDHELYKEVGVDAMATNASQIIDIIEDLKDK